jgi:hypothetical protein
MERGQETLLRAISLAAGLEIVAAGGPAEERAIAAEFGAECVRDLRRGLATVEADLALFMSAGAMEGFGALDDAEAMRSCVDRGVKIASMEPAPGSTQALVAHERGGGPPFGELVRFVPLTRRSRGFRAAAEALERIGPVRTVAISQRGGAGQGSLAAKLYDAMDLTHALLGDAESIDAANAGPVSASGVRLAPGERLRALRGDITANIRCGSGRSVSLALSDSAGRWFRGVTVVGQGGTLRLDDKSFEVIGPDGETADRSRSRVSSGAEGSAEGAGAAVAEQIAQMFDPRAAGVAPGGAVELAMCEAALLSARTGQPESPATILRMAGVI